MNGVEISGASADAAIADLERSRRVGWARAYDAERRVAALETALTRAESDLEDMGGRVLLLHTFLWIALEQARRGLDEAAGAALDAAYDVARNLHRTYLDEIAHDHGLSRGLDWEFLAEFGRPHGWDWLPGRRGFAYQHVTDPG